MSGILSSSIIAGMTAGEPAPEEPTTATPAPATAVTPAAEPAQQAQSAQQTQPAQTTQQTQPAQSAQQTQPAETTTAGGTPVPILVTAEDRIPAGEQPAFAPEEMIAPISGIIYYVPDEYTYRPSTVAAATPTAGTAAVTNPAATTATAGAAMATTATASVTNPVPGTETLPAGTGSPFTVPLINGIERGTWYVQVGAFSRSDSVEYEINRIGTAYPTVVQITGTDSTPVYRVLLGPMNQGESGAMLQRLKSIGYRDAFIRSN
jgi:hypothetical protein